MTEIIELFGPARRGLKQRFPASAGSATIAGSISGSGDRARAPRQIAPLPPESRLGQVFGCNGP
jgi:hypothetical protein